jgi:murein DD-endopeptidase MepM/ murein hydrolase activator NlpD
MRAFSLLLIATSALCACGTHSSVRQAPIVYGTQPGSGGRAYSPQPDYSRATPAYAQSSPSLATTGPAPLTPVTAEIYQSELPPVPTYVSAPAAPSARQAGGRIVVQPGDTVYAIARRTGASPQSIIQENGLRPPYRLEIGDALILPDPERKIANRIAEAAPTKTAIAANRTHRVRRGDTLYSISRSSGVPIKTLASANGLRAPYTLDVGQQILVPGAASAGSAVAIERGARPPSQDVAEIARTVSYAPPPAQSAKLFDWPVKGAVIGQYGAGLMGRRNDGINIAAPVGTPVRAAADGEVVYRGSELDGYGNLLLIKHGDGFVTAYAHNDAMLVKKGDLVRQGQVIAKVGQTGAATEPQLHFEIRQDLKSVDPLGFLQN